MQTQILATAHAIGTCASSVTVKVAPQPPAATIPDRSKPLSPAAATHLRAAAASFTDPEWRVLFLELASLAETADSPAPEARSEERRVGKTCVSTGRSRWSAEH